MYKDAKYVKGLTKMSDRPTPLPEILLVGRSNVGKSSFINALLERKSLARTSNTPGKTLTLNYYEIDQRFYLVDAPGYGYARRSKSMKGEFVRMISSILGQSSDLVAVFHLIDFKVGPTEDDLEVHRDLLGSGLLVHTIATKTDKVPKTRRHAQKKNILKALGETSVLHTVSNVEKAGFEPIKQLIEEALERSVTDASPDHHD
ncbi:MAG: ribosome biogenesis GTP-binding protein YihA/YsxC [Acholeplasmataceae bacterium]|nr:ribosome biogenesis GTP-binding protein YihA/YsxC [Acholeplasmataceae bacterium]